MALATMSWYWLVGVAIVGVIVVAVLTVALRRRRQHVWRRFAARHGLRFQNSDLGPRVYGTKDGYEVELKVVAESSDTGPLGIEEIRMTMELLNRVPEGLSICEAEGVLGEVNRALEADHIETGDHEFDHAVVVKANDEQLAREWLDEERRRSLLSFVQQRPTNIVALDGRTLSCQDREMISSLDVTEECLRLLLETARRLDAGVKA